MATDPDALVQARERVEALRAGFEEGKDGPVRLVQTHISWVLLTGALAYQLKKPMRLPFLDLTTLDSRRHFCSKELRLSPDGLQGLERGRLSGRSELAVKR